MTGGDNARPFSRHSSIEASAESDVVSLPEPVTTASGSIKSFSFTATHHQPYTSGSPPVSSFISVVTREKLEKQQAEKEAELIKPIRAEQAA